MRRTMIRLGMCGIVWGLCAALGSAQEVGSLLQRIKSVGKEGWTAPNLDDYVEMDLERLANLKVDFEIEDALAKLERLKLVTKVQDRYAALPIDKALETLDYAWDNYFKYNVQGK